MINKLLAIATLITLTLTTLIITRLPTSTLHLITLTLLTLISISAITGLVMFILFAKEEYLQRQAKRVDAQHSANVKPMPSSNGETYISRTKEWAAKSELIPAHFLSSPYNGHSVEVTQYEQQRWLIKNQPAKVIEGQSQPLLPSSIELLPLLPVLLKAQRVIIGGGSDSGKSTVAKHLILARSQEGEIIPIDPHSPSKLLGIDVIGAGRDWPAIGSALESLELLMHERYTEVAQGLMGYFQHQKISIFIDEWTSIIEEVPDAGKRLKTLLTESRKVNMFLTLLTHATTLDGLGLPSAQLKKSALIVELVGGNGDQPYRAFVYPQTTLTPEGKKAKPIEYLLPGPFAGFPEPTQICKALPSPQLIKIQRMANEGMSKRAMIKVLYPEVDNPNKKHYQLIDEYLASTQVRQVDSNES